jgi:hypothetical protein
LLGFFCIDEVLAPALVVARGAREAAAPSQRLALASLATGPFWHEAAGSVLAAAASLEGVDSDVREVPFEVPFFEGESLHQR